MEKKSEKNSPDRKKNSPILPGFELEPLLKALPVLLFLIDRDGTFLNFHAGNPDDLPLSPEQIVGSNIRDLPDAKLGKQTLASLKRVFRTGTPERFEYRVETRRGWQHYVCHLRRYGVNEVLASIRNITEQTHQRKQQQQRTEAILRESEAKYRTLVENTQDLLYRTDLEGRIVYVSGAVERLSGYTAAEAIGMKMAEEVYVRPEARV